MSRTIAQRVTDPRSKVFFRNVRIRAFDENN